ncbi:MAG: hypothetical protein BWY82_02645 [Verrucomicrobia bacterium ADurb.Bin474]|nr:MAG: hypothetical protein BWY82_02645 [Verrucomicrobia bacterium ADurb.Bin474]
MVSKRFRQNRILDRHEIGFRELEAFIGCPAERAMIHNNIVGIGKPHRVIRSTRKPPCQFLRCGSVSVGPEAGIRHASIGA